MRSFVIAGILAAVLGIQAARVVREYRDVETIRGYFLSHPAVRAQAAEKCRTRRAKYDPVICHLTSPTDISPLREALQASVTEW